MPKCRERIAAVRAFRLVSNLYNPETMPADLLRARESLDAAVESAYGATFNNNEEKMVAHLLERYAELDPS